MKLIFSMAFVQLQPHKIQPVNTISPNRFQPINPISQISQISPINQITPISPNRFQLSNSNYNMINRIQNGGKCLACNKQ